MDIVLFIMGIVHVLIKILEFKLNFFNFDNDDTLDLFSKNKKYLFLFPIYLFTILPFFYIIRFFPTHKYVNFLPYIRYFHLPFLP